MRWGRGECGRVRGECEREQGEQGRERVGDGAGGSVGGYGESVRGNRGDKGGRECAGRQKGLLNRSGGKC